MSKKNEHPFQKPFWCIFSIDVPKYQMPRKWKQVIVLFIKMQWIVVIFSMIISKPSTISWGCEIKNSLK